MSAPDKSRARLARNGLWQPRQMAGRRWRIGCVSLEITQRCNLDCSLCYLSEHAEAVRDLTMQENFRADRAARVVYLSEILNFYAEDFVPAHARSLLEYANRYAANPAPADYATRFTPYDWTVANSRRWR